MAAGEEEGLIAHWKMRFLQKSSARSRYRDDNGLYIDIRGTIMASTLTSEGPGLPRPCPSFDRSGLIEECGFESTKLMDHGGGARGIQVEWEEK